jgi:protease-4
MRTLWRLIAGFFKWTWRILNFIRKLALNAIFPGAGAGVYRYLEPVQQHHQRTCARGALLLDITGVVVDKPSASSKLGVIGRQLFGASSDRLQENSLFDIVRPFARRKMTAISPVSCWI